MILTENQYNPKPYWTNRATREDILEDPKCVNLFDQNGYYLTKVEQAFAETNGQPAINRRHETVLRSDWITLDKYEKAHINHSDLFERKAYGGKALEQLEKYAIENPMLYKIVKMKPKWGLDISIDYVSKNNVFEVFHYEWDSFEFEQIEAKKREIEDFVLSRNWDEEAEKLIEIKDEWIDLPFFEQSEWRTNYYNLEPERFKNVIWEE